MRLLYDNGIKDAILTPSSENANYPASNLKDPRLSRHLRFTGDKDEHLLIDSGGLLKDIFQATINLLENSDDLTLWTTQAATVVASGLFYDGTEFAKVTNSGAAAGWIHQTETGLFTTLTLSGNVICRKGNSAGNEAHIFVYDVTVPAYIFDLIIGFDNYPNSPGTPAFGNLRWYRWIDSQTIELHFTCASLAVLTDDVEFRLYGSRNATAGEYTYWMRPQLEDLPYDTPYVDGSRAAVSPTHAFQMLEKFIFKVKVRPWFVYTIARYPMFISWYIDVTHRLMLYYEPSEDKIRLFWHDGVNALAILSQQFDDGTAFDDINSELIIFSATRLDQQIGQRFFVIVDGVKQTEDTSFDGVPDTKSSTFPTLSIGHENSAEHGDSQFESVQFWAWDGSGLGTLNSEADIDAALKDSPPIFEQIYQPKIKASYAALAGHNLSADALIKVQGNDWNSWNGPPFEQTLVWDADIILKNFTEKEYPYWRFLLDNPNNADGYIKLGLAYLGRYYQVLQGFEKNFTASLINTDVSDFSDSGQAYSRKGIDYRRYQLDFTWWEDAVKREIEAIIKTVGKRNPFFALLDEKNLIALPPLYCQIEKEPDYKNLIGYIWQTPLILKEVF